MNLMTQIQQDINHSRFKKHIQNTRCKARVVKNRYKALHCRKEAIGAMT